VFYSRTASLPDVMRNILNVVIASLVVLMIMMNYAWPLF
jgi:hypothetical protein